MSSCGTRAHLRRRAPTACPTEACTIRAAHRDHAQSRFLLDRWKRDNPQVAKRRLAMRRSSMLDSKFLAVLMLAGPATVLSPIISPAHAAVPVSAAPAEGVVKQRSDYGFDETIVRVKADIASKGIRFFDEIDQTKLGASASLPINRSTLLLF